jgi:two-component system sensor histidine kinase TctE
VAVSLVLTWLVAQGIAGKPFDRALEYNVGELAQLVTVSTARCSSTCPSRPRAAARRRLRHGVLPGAGHARGEYLSGERDLPLPPDDEKLAPGEVRMRDDEFRGRCQGGLHLGAG